VGSKLWVRFVQLGLVLEIGFSIIVVNETKISVLEVQASHGNAFLPYLFCGY